MAPYELAGLITHVVVLGLGLGGIARCIRLPRGPRTGVGLVLMALSMFVLAFGPISGFGWLVTFAHPVLFGVALWLLIGPWHPPRDVQVGRDGS